ncbi:MAG: hypothetical protein ACRCYO_13455 [Bacteroidia bacterium]
MIDTPKEEPKLTHWKKLTNPKYLGSHDWTDRGKEATMTIDKVVREMVKGDKGKEEECTICYFEKSPKPMILNKVNAKIITKVLETPYIEQWKGRRIILYVTKVDAFGEIVDAIRVKNQKAP